MNEYWYLLSESYTCPKSFQSKIELRPIFDRFDFPSIFGARVVGNCKQQKQPPRGFLRKSCSENMQQIYRRTLMLKCDFNIVAKQLQLLKLLKQLKLQDFWTTASEITKVIFYFQLLLQSTDVLKNLQNWLSRFSFCILYSLLYVDLHHQIFVSSVSIREFVTRQVSIF